ncbi:hypothetical protein K1F50_07045 [Muricauda oceani]|uniref:DUF4133 domain-containing protein n=1 Tax=Flagellimonas oceani TaxID=2698672 RepID=A0A6G7J623_9FLAO|nr:hypothetical protein [Allomuricauda oceani]MBW8242554.1 hypothetical protein [Allomuricauda oceani]QII46313.1 hypothetical protein GVT53_17030 [Allomuricauda oceani]
MKQYSIYSNIRVRALIFGLPVDFFALQMMAIVGSLMAIIFSFSLMLLIGVGFVNAVLYGVLLKLAQAPGMLQIGVRFPHSISNKKITPYEYYDELS